MVKVAVIGLLLALAGLQYRLWVADGGYAEIHRLHGQIDQLSAQTDRMQARNEAQEAEIADLKSGVSAMEGRARAELGMIRGDEQFYLIVDQGH